MGSCLTAKRSVSVFCLGLECGLHATDLKSPKDALLLGFFSQIAGGRELVPGGQPWRVCVAVCCPSPGEGGGEAAAKSFILKSLNAARSGVEAGLKVPLAQLPRLTPLPK